MPTDSRAPFPHGISTKVCLALVVANMIGTGVFTSLGFQLNEIDRAPVILLLWTLGGVLALCGALSYAELALAIPRSGGEYHFLTRIYHPAAGFVGGLTSVTVGFAAPTALAAIAFAHYLAAAVPGVPVTPAALAVVLLTAFAHFWTLRIGGSFQMTFTLLKVGLILVFIGAGVFFADPQPVRLLPESRDWSGIASAPFAISLIYVMYAYSGWNAVVYILGEVRDVRRSVLPALAGGTLLVAILYITLNAVFLRAAPMEEMRGQVEAGEVAARFVFGEKGGALMSGLICLGLISAVSAMMWTGPRVMQTMGEDLHFLKPLAHKSSAGIPRRALALQTFLVAVLVVTGSFEQVLVYTQFTLCICTFMTVLGVIVLRWKEPSLPRPFRCWLYPLPPLFYLGIVGFTMFHLAFSKPWETLAGVCTLCAFLMVYRLTK